MDNNNWTEGNQPEEFGLFWITLSNMAESLTVLPARFDDLDRRWHMLDRSYATILSDNVKAYKKVNTPKPYRPNAIGYKDEFYIMITDQNGNTSYYSKQFTPINWSKIGYSTAEKAANAARRQRRLNILEYPHENKNYYVVNGDNEIARIIAEDM